MDVNSKIETIKNLINKNTENGATEEEAMQSIALAQKLMQKYSITFDDLKNHNINEKDFGWGSNEDMLSRNRVSTFENLVSFSISKFTDTKCVKQKYRCKDSAKNCNSIIMFYGYTVDVELAKFLLKTCIDTYEYEWNMYKNKHNIHGNKKKIFGYGMAIRISNRIKELMEENVSSESTSLIVVKDQLVNSMYMEELNNRNMKTKSNNSLPINIDAENADELNLMIGGYISGGKVKLHKEVSIK